MKIYATLSPWELGQHATLLAERLFGVMDASCQGRVTLYSFIQTLGVLLRGDLKRRLYLLYQLHVVPVPLIPVPLIPGVGTGRVTMVRLVIVVCVYLSTYVQTLYHLLILILVD